MKPISAEEVQKFLKKGRDAEEGVTAHRFLKNVKTIRFTIVSPDAGPIATGVTNALTQIAASIEDRYKDTTVKVSLE
jgi:hypothetical protein